MYEKMIHQIASNWGKARHAVVFTGAGMSTESGLPDFRSATGLWKQRPESLATLGALKQQPDEFYFFYQWRIAKLWEVQPNDGHIALASLQRAGLLNTIITQNVDGLHQQAGTRNVVELHGSLRTVTCVQCRERYDSRVLLPINPNWEKDYAENRYHFSDECTCEKCSGLLRPDVVLFGESLPEEAWNDSIELSRKADFFVVIGSSLAVSPANLCPDIAKRSGGKLLIINHEATSMDEKADWVLRESSVKALNSIINAM